MREDAVPAQMAMGDLTGVVSLWTGPAAPTIPAEIGAVSTDGGFASAGQVKFGKSWIGSAAAGEFDFSSMTSGPIIGGQDPRFHRTDTIDLGVVLSGRAELHLENGQQATVQTGSCFVITGMQHYWQVVGASRSCSRLHRRRNSQRLTVTSQAHQPDRHSQAPA